MAKHNAPFAILSVILISTWAYGQGLPDPPPERTTWDHNGSTMYLIANGSSRELFYDKPRQGMVEAGAKSGSLLFRGEVSNGQYSGTAYIFSQQCGQVPFNVKGAILDDGKRIVLKGQAPQIGRNCQTIASYGTTLEFKLLKTIAETPAAEPQRAEEPKTKSPSTADKTLDTPSQPAPASVPPPAKTITSPTKEATVNMAQLPAETPLSKHGEKAEIAENNFETYVSAGSVIIVVCGLLFLLAKQRWSPHKR